MRSYPSFEAARFWTGSAFAAAAGAAMAMLRVVFPDSLVPLLFGGTALILAICLAAMGVRKFFDRPVSWRGTVLITGLGLAGLSFFIFDYDSVPARMTVFTIAQALPMALSLKLLLSPHQGRVNPGARLAGVVTILIIGDFRGPAGRRADRYRRRVLLHAFQPGAIGRHPGAGVPVDGAEFRLPADGDGPPAQRGRGSGAARRSHRRRQPPLSAAAPDGRMRALGTQQASRSRCW